jgi:rhodanese-related sulfurtransferase
LVSSVLFASFLPCVAHAGDVPAASTSWGWSTEACDQALDPRAQWTPREPREATVAEVARWKAASAAVPVDTSSQQTRAREGVIPGAVLLTSSAEYALQELPSDHSTRLVFYCGSTRCSASHQAARRAMEVGYTDVWVLPVGITGWKAAGQAAVEAGC